ncbi:MAG: GAF domain-containing protein [Methyloligellaceae bacterium]
MFKNNFIKAIEIWRPVDGVQVSAAYNKVGMFLELADSYYQDADEFRDISSNHKVFFNEGLVGQAWAEGRPKLLHNLQSSDCIRGQAAVKAGFNCTLAIPLFAGESIASVVTLFCSDDESYVGSVELWHKPIGTNEISLDDGYFQTDSAFEAESRKVKFMRGFGIAGIVWGTQLPFIMNNLGRNKRFVRSGSAARTGLTRGMGIPCGRKTEDEAWVVTLLSSLDTPIADRFEYWVPQDDGLVFSNGVCAHDRELVEYYSSHAMPLGAGALAQVWQTGIPTLNTDLAAEPEVIATSVKSAGLSMQVVLPVYWGERVSAVAAWYL